MRISDWSSDVCSSDLGRRLAAGPWSELLQVEGGQFADVVDGQVRRRVECLPGGLVRVVPLAHEDGGQAVAQHALHGGQQLRLVVDHHVVARGIAPLDRVEHVLLVQEIGRASCRDRVCRYLYICVVPGSLKKNNKTQVSTLP